MQNASCNNGFCVVLNLFLQMYFVVVNFLAQQHSRDTLCSFLASDFEANVSVVIVIIVVGRQSNEIVCARERASERCCHQMK